MRFFNWLFVSLLTVSTFMFADGNARLQVIHNAADPAAAEVDIYVNDGLLLDNFAFRAATPFIDVPAGVYLDIGVAPATSSSSADVIATFTVKFKKNKTYIAVANGVLDPAAFAANPDGREIGFTLFSRDGIREAGSDAANVDFVVLHGASDAPAVDVIARDVATLVDGAAYGDITDYISVPAGAYTLDITPDADNNTVVASFGADLSGLGGGSAVVFASGFLTPSANQDGAAFGIYAALADGTVIGLPAADPPVPMARLQVIHNAADPGAASVDIYVNGGLLLDDFGFRTATPFIDVPAEVALTVGVAPGTSTGAGDIIASFDVTLANGGTYVAMANGVLDPSAFAANPDGRSTGFTIFTKADARESGSKEDRVDVFVVHGSTDAPAVRINTNNLWIDGAAYGDITGYFSLRAQRNVIDVKVPGHPNIRVGKFEADLTGLEGAAAVVFASGFVDPSANNGGEGFGLFAALPNGAVVELPAIEPAPANARLQVIHNAADPAAASVDIYVGDDLLLDDFAFRAATPFIDVPANTDLAIGVAPGTSTSSADIIATFDVRFKKNRTYVAVANGVLDPSAFAANPDGRSIGFTLFARDKVREAAKDHGNVDFIVLHGATDAPAVDVIARDVATLVDDAAYGDITNYISVPAGAYTLDVTPANDNSTIVASFAADLSGLAGGAAVVFASGFLTPSANQDGEAFGIYAALPDGTVIGLPAASTSAATSIAGQGLSSLTTIDDFALNQNYPNPFNPSTTIAFALPTESNVTLKVYDVQGREVATLVNDRMDAGQHSVNFDASNIATGVYFYRIEAGSFQAIRRMMLVK